MLWISYLISDLYRYTRTFIYFFSPNNRSRYQVSSSSLSVLCYRCFWRERQNQKQDPVSPYCFYFIFLWSVVHKRESTVTNSSLFFMSMNSNPSVLDFFLERLHTRIFSHMTAEAYLCFESRILKKEYAWGKVSVLTSPKKNISKTILYRKRSY